MYISRTKGFENGWHKEKEVSLIINSKLNLHNVSYYYLINPVSQRTASGLILVGKPLQVTRVYIHKQFFQFQMLYVIIHIKRNGACEMLKAYKVIDYKMCRYFKFDFCSTPVLS